MTRYTAPTEHEKRTSMIEALVHVMGNNCRLYRTARCIAWNTPDLTVSGANTLLQELSDEILQAQDRIAERVIELGGVAVPDDTEAVIIPRPAEIDYRTDPSTDLIDLMIEGFRQARFSLEAAHDVASEIEDQATQDLMTERLAKHNRHVALLSACIELSTGVRN